MTYLEVAEWVAADLEPDGDSFLTVPTEAPYFSTSWGKRLAAYISNFTVDSYLLYSASTACTITTGDRIYSFADTANCTKHFFDVDALFVNNYPLSKIRNVAELMRGWNPGIAAATPMSWAQLDKSRIIFNTEVSSLLTGTYAQGFYRHPAITSDAQELEIVEPEYLELFSRYAQVMLREKVASDDIGMARLQRVDQQSYQAVLALRSERFAQMMSRDRC